MVRQAEPVSKPLTRRDLVDFDEANVLLEQMAWFGAGSDGWHHYQAFLLSPGGGQVQVATGRYRGEMLGQLRQQRITGPVVIEGPGQLALPGCDRLPVYRFEDGQVTGRLTRRQARQWADRLVHEHEGFRELTGSIALYLGKPWPPQNRTARQSRKKVK
jgi:hypothetical protein